MQKLIAQQKFDPRALYEKINGKTADEVIAMAVNIPTIDRNHYNNSLNAVKQTLDDILGEL